jgi:hypothetical protein
MSGPAGSWCRLNRLIGELRGLPDGLRTPVRAGLLVADVLAALGLEQRAIAGVVGTGMEPHGRRRRAYRRLARSCAGRAGVRS